MKLSRDTESHYLEITSLSRDNEVHHLGITRLFLYFVCHFRSFVIYDGVTKKNRKMSLPKLRNLVTKTTVVYLGECTPIQLFNSLMRLVISLATRLSYYRVDHGKRLTGIILCTLKAVIVDGAVKHNYSVNVIM